MDDAIARRVSRKVVLRLVPFLFVLYIVAFLDRVNVGNAALQMNKDLGFSTAVYGFGAGIFFIGYFIFEVPSNMLLHRLGARLWIARIMLTWGLISGATMFIQTPLHFYVIRFLLGFAEAGFFPGMILYLTYWIPAAERARVVALFMTAIPLAGVVAGFLAAPILAMGGLGGLAGWQWIFLIEAAPAVVLGVVVLFYLTDRPEKAAWLSAEERESLISRLAAEGQVHEQHGKSAWYAPILDGRVALLAVIYLALVTGLYGFGFFLPLLIKGFSGLDASTVSLLTTIPYFVSAVGMVLISRHSDQTGERRWHVAAPLLVGAAGLAIAAASQNVTLAMIGFSIAAVGIYGGLAPFWTLPTAFLSGIGAAVGIATINSIGNLGGFIGPYTLGVLDSRTGLLVLAAVMTAGAVLTVVFVRSAPTSEVNRGG